MFTFSMMTMWILAGSIQIASLQNHCFSGDCGQGSSLLSCTNGDWICENNEFCEINFYLNGFAMTCHHGNHQEVCATHEEHSACSENNIHNCALCCDTADCVRDFAATPLVTAVTQGTTLAALDTTEGPAASTGIQCVQCGDYDLNVPCTTMELLLDSTTECTVPGQNFCMTDAATDSDSVTTYIKRCVNRQTCHTLWYLESLGQNVCRNFDESTPDVSCHFCCVEDGCNISILPAENTLYNGHR